MDSLPSEIHYNILNSMDSATDFLNLCNTCKKLRKIYVDDEIFKIKWFVNNLKLEKNKKDICNILELIDKQFNNVNIFSIIKNNILFIDNIFKLNIKEAKIYYINRIKRRLFFLNKDKIDTYKENDENIIIDSFNLCLKYNLFFIINLLNNNTFISNYLYTLIIYNTELDIKKKKLLLFSKNWTDFIQNLNNVIDINDLDILIKWKRWQNILRILKLYNINENNIYIFKLLNQYNIPINEINYDISKRFIENKIYKCIKKTYIQNINVITNLLKIMYKYIESEKSSEFFTKEIVKFIILLDNNIDIFSIIIKNFDDNKYTKKLISMLLDQNYKIDEKNFLIIIEKNMINVLKFLFNIIYIDKNFIKIKNLFLIGIKYKKIKLVQYLIEYKIYELLGNDYIKELITIKDSGYNNPTIIIINNLIEREKEKQNINFNLDAEDFLESEFSDF